MSDDRTYFRLCSSCKSELPFGSRYYACSVSTCNRKRTALSFCSVACWEAHVPLLRHRDAWAEERQAPTSEQWRRETEEEAAKQEARHETRREASASHERERSAPDAPVRRMVGVGAEPAGVTLRDAGVPQDTLIVVSKLKAYIRARSGMNTSDGCAAMLSDIVRELCDGAIRRAAEDGRKTVMDRDF